MVVMAIVGAVSNQAWALSEKECFEVVDQMVKEFNSKSFKASITADGTFTDLKAYRMKHTIHLTLTTSKSDDLKNLTTAERQQIAEVMRSQILQAVRSDEAAYQVFKEVKVNMAITIKSPSGQKVTTVIKYTDF